MTTAMETQRPLVNLDNLGSGVTKKLPEAICKFIDAAQTATGRSSFYNTKEEQDKAMQDIHRDLFVLDRGLYSLCLLLPGLLDQTKRHGLGMLLDNPPVGTESSLVDPTVESRIIAKLSNTLPPQRLLKMFEQFRRERVNNSRTKRLILRSILCSENFGDFWAIKYRYKLRRALEHAWSKRVTSILRSILGKRFTKNKTSLTGKEGAILRDKILRFVHPGRDLLVLECVAFILGHEEELSLPLLKAYVEAKKDFTKAKGIPLSNLMYLRGRFHLDKVTKAQVYELAKGQMTETEKSLTHKSTKKEGVEVSFDPEKIEATKLYIYLYEMAETLTKDARKKIDAALKRKGEEAARKLLATHKNVGVVLDLSQSMMGSETQKLRPLATSLACIDMLEASVRMRDGTLSLEVTGVGSRKADLPIPCGDTSLAEALVTVLKKKPEIVYVLSDGYENAPAGRFAEVINALRKMGNETPIVQIVPVLAAESKGVRHLSDKILALPLNKPEALATSMLKNVLMTDLRTGLLGIVETAAKQLSGPKTPALEVKNG